MSSEERTRDPWSTHGGLTASHKSLRPHPVSTTSLFFSSAFQSSPRAKPKTEITGLGPSFPTPSFPLSYSHLHRFPSTERLSRTNHVPWTTEVLQPAHQTSHREATPMFWWPLALLAFLRGTISFPIPPASRCLEVHVRCTSLSFNAKQAGGLKQLMESKSKLFTRCRASPLRATISRDFAFCQPSLPHFLWLHSLVPRWL